MDKNPQAFHAGFVDCPCKCGRMVNLVEARKMKENNTSHTMSIEQERIIADEKESA